LPGLLFGLCLVGLVLWTSHKRGYPKGEPVALKDVPKIVTDALWGLVTIFIIMGGILSGVFTPTESAAVACVYAFLVTFLVYRDYKWSELPRMVHRVVKTVSMVMMLIGFSVAFGYMMTLMQIQAKITMFFLSISDNKYVFLFLVNLLLLLLGTFMDLAPMLLICTPIFMPVIAKLGIDPVHFGMIMIMPKCTGSMPSLAITGMKMGVQMSSMGAKSMKVPSNNSSKLTKNKNTYLLSEMLKKNMVILACICIKVIM